MLETLEAIDRAWLLKINACNTAWLDVIMWQLSRSWHTYLLVIAGGYFVYKKFQLRKATEFVLGCAIMVACTDSSTNLIKHAVKRYRPTHNTEIGNKVHVVNNYKGGQFGFFSAHSANTFGLAGFAFMCFGWLDKRKRFVFFLYPALVAYSRVYLGVHYPSEVFTGAVWGLLWALPVFAVMNRYFFKSNA